MHEFRELNASGFTIRPGNPEDMMSVMEGVGRQRRFGWLLFISGASTSRRASSMTNEALIRLRRLGCSGVVHLLQALAAAESLAVDDIWLVTHAAQPIEGRTGTFEVAQSPLWGLGRVAAAEYKNLRFRLVDLTTCSREEIVSFVDELNAADDAEDEIALHGELRYVHRLVPISPATLRGMGRQNDAAPFRDRIAAAGNFGILRHPAARAPAAKAPRGRD